MHSLKQAQLDDFLDRITLSVEQLRCLDLWQDAEREQALAASRQLLGTLALYRNALQAHSTGQPGVAPERFSALQAA